MTVFIRGSLIAFIFVHSIGADLGPTHMGDSLYLGQEPGIAEYKRGMFREKSNNQLLHFVLHDAYFTVFIELLMPKGVDLAFPEELPELMALESNLFKPKR